MVVLAGALFPIAEPFVGGMVDRPLSDLVELASGHENPWRREAPISARIARGFVLGAGAGSPREIDPLDLDHLCCLLDGRNDTGCNRVWR